MRHSMTDNEIQNNPPSDVVEEAERLTRLARNAVDEAEAAVYRSERERLISAHAYTARVRDEDETLVLYPEQWITDGTVQLDQIEDTDRAVEVPLTPQPGESWAAVEAHNQTIIDRVAADHSEDHVQNVRSFADFMGNHYLQTLDTATAEQIEEFYTEYYPRNAWPSPSQRSLIEESIELAFTAVDKSYPL